MSHRVASMAAIFILSWLTCGFAAASPSNTAESVEVGSPEQDLDNLNDFDGLDDLDDLDALDDLDSLSGGGSGGGSSGLKSFKGFVANETRFYTQQRGGTQNDQQSIAELQLEMDIAIGGGLRLFIRPWFLIDVLDTDLLRSEPLEAYLEYSSARWDIRAGQFVESWGIADTFNPVDVLNRRDVAVDVLDPEFRGETGLRVRYSGEGGEVIGQPSVALYAIPLWRATPFPTDANRFSFSQNGPALRDDDAIEPNFADGMLVAARFEHTLSAALFNADMQYLVARGPDRFPTFSIAATSTEARFIPEYFGSWIGGGGFRATPNADWWSKLTFKAEVVYKSPYRFSGMQAPLPDSYVQYATGVDRQIAPFFSSKDQLTLTVEYVGEQGANDITADFRPFQSDLVTRLFWEANNFARQSIEFRAIVDLENGEAIFEGILKGQLRFIHDDLNLLVAARQIRRAPNGQSFFALFPNNSSVRARLQFDF